MKKFKNLKEEGHDHAKCMMFMLPLLERLCTTLACPETLKKLKIVKISGTSRGTLCPCLPLKIPLQELSYSKSSKQNTRDQTVKTQFQQKYRNTTKESNNKIRCRIGCDKEKQTKENTNNKRQHNNLGFLPRNACLTLLA